MEKGKSLSYTPVVLLKGLEEELGVVSNLVNDPLIFYNLFPRRVDELATMSIGAVSFQVKLAAGFGFVFGRHALLASQLFLPMSEATLCDVKSTR